MGRLRAKGQVEGLEARQLMTADVAMIGATTLDSKGVTVDYRISGGDLDRPLQLGVYRSADATFSPDDVSAGTVSVPVGRLDAAGQSATAVGTHHLTASLALGLSMNPSHPYVLVVADPGTAASTAPDHTASFRKYTIGVIIHGGVQPKSWDRGGPPWVARMAASLRAEGYDDVIAHNWAAISRHPGSANTQGPRVAHEIEAAAEGFPAGAPVDLQVIGHSEGASIASQALIRLQPTPGLAAGSVEMTLLDPHAASNNFKGKQVSTSSGMLGSFAKGEIDAFQSKAKDAAVYIPGNVDDAQVYYQHTPVGVAKTNGGVYNLWGQVPVLAAPGVPVRYSNLTAPGISHAGDFGVFDWYQVNVVPKLANGPAFVAQAHPSARRHPVG